MPAIAQKAKALSGKGVVLSYVDKPENFYWREQVPSTKRYLHRLLPNSSTLEEALEECIEAYTALRKDQAITHGTDGTTQLRAQRVKEEPLETQTTIKSIGWEFGTQTKYASPHSKLHG